MRICNLWLCLMVVWLCTTSAWANETFPVDTVKQKHHVIVAFNWSPKPVSTGWVHANVTKDAVYALSKFEMQDGEGKVRKVLEQGDVFSCLAFRADVKNNHLEQYVQPVMGREGKPVLFQNTLETTFPKNLYRNWSTWLNSDPFGTDTSLGYSLLSVAKPFCLKYFANSENKVLVNRTFLIMVSDKQFNGDMYDEIANLRNDNHTYGNHIQGIKDEQVFPIYYQVNQSYFIRLIASKPIKFGGNEWSMPKGYVQLFEFVPLQKNFVLSSVFDYPAQLQAKRIRGGKYRCELPLINRNHPSYKPVKLQVYLNDGLQNSWGEVDLQESVNYSFEQDEDEKVSHVTMKGWVRVQDGIYNATLMSPLSEAMEEAGREGLNIKLNIEYEKKAKIFFFPMPDFMWLGIMPDDQAVAALVWELILGLIMLALVIAGVIRLIHKNQYMTPDVKDMKFKITYNKVERS